MMDETGSRYPTVTGVVVCLVVLMGAEVLSASGSQARKFSGITIEQGANSVTGIAERTSRRIVGEAKDVELVCPIPHETPQQVEWYKQNPGGRGKKRITQFRNRYELSNGEMTIHSLTTDDAGTYVCKVSNKSELRFIQLVVSGEQSIKNNHIKLSQNRKGSSEELYAEPQIAKTLLPKQKIYYVAKGFPILLLKCESSGNPKPTITWYNNGGMISSSTTNVSTLKLVNVSQADSGHYICESVNLFGISKYEVTIQVTDYWFGASEILELSPRNVTASEGSSVNISCVARFEMDPWFSWVRRIPSNKTESGKVFFHSGTAAYYEVLKSTDVKPRGDSGIYSTDLVITNVTKNDSGVYYCAVAGLQGYNLSDATITVEPDPTQFLSANIQGVAAQWAILWTISFIFLVMLVILCFVNLYGCRPHKPTTKPVPQPANNRSQHCHLPESSPLTMSTQCTTQESFVPLMVGGGGSCSGLSSYGDPFENDYDSPSASNVLIYDQNQRFPACSYISSSSSANDCESSRSYRPNSICSDYQCNSSVSNPSSWCHRPCCHRVVEVHRQHCTGRSIRSKNLERKKQAPHYPCSFWENGYPKSNDADYCQSTDCESCTSPVPQPHRKTTASKMSNPFTNIVLTN